MATTLTVSNLSLKPNSSPPNSNPPPNSGDSSSIYEHDGGKRVKGKGKGKGTLEVL